MGLVWALFLARHVLLLLLVGALGGVLLDGAARAVAVVVHTSPRRAARVVVATLVVGVVATALAAAPWLARRLGALLSELPPLVTRVDAALRAHPWGRRLLDVLPPEDTVDWTGWMAWATSGLASGALGFTLVVLVGVGLGVAPGRYSRPILAALPPVARDRAARVGTAAYRALQLWLIGRLVDMAILATLTSAGLAWLGVPHAVALGGFAGLLEFVPYAGPFLATAPIAATALAASPDLVLPAIALYGALQMVQSYVVTPLVEQRSVEVPPAVGVAAQVVGSWVAGPLGLLVATPVVVLLTVLVQTLWIEGVLKEPIHVLGER